MFQNQCLYSYCKYLGWDLWNLALQTLTGKLAHYGNSSIEVNLDEIAQRNLFEIHLANHKLSYILQFC